MQSIDNQSLIVLQHEAFTSYSDLVIYPCLGVEGGQGRHDVGTLRTANLSPELKRERRFVRHYPNRPCSSFTIV